MHVHIYIRLTCVQETYATRHSLQLKIKTTDCLHKNFPYFVFLKTVLTLKNMYSFSQIIYLGIYYLLHTRYETENRLAKMTGKRIENEVLGKLSFSVISS